MAVRFAVCLRRLRRPGQLLLEVLPCGPDAGEAGQGMRVQIGADRRWPPLVYIRPNTGDVHTCVFAVRSVAGGVTPPRAHIISSMLISQQIHRRSELTVGNQTSICIAAIFSAAHP